MAQDAIENLAPYAASAALSRGRQYTEEEDSRRHLYQRDCDRIIHAAAFRCLEGKAQVMVNHVAGSFRTRLTHSMEVARLSRALARTLRLNEDLAEAIALAHDLGHTPFSHPGEDALDRCMKDYGGFEHNVQSLRVVDKLEHKYAQFRGLNLSFETRDGLLKRCARDIAENLGDVGARVLRGERATLEAQIVNLADHISYTNHDLDDGLRLGFLELAEVQELELFARAWQEASKLAPDLSRHCLLHETNRRMIDRMMNDLIVTTRTRIEKAAPDSLEAVRTQDEDLAGFSAEMRHALAPVTQLLHRRYYDHFELVRTREMAVRVIEGLFGSFMDCPKLLPGDLHERVQIKQEAHGDAGCARVAADYIASLSDRAILAEYRKVFGVPGIPEL